MRVFKFHTFDILNVIFFTLCDFELFPKNEAVTVGRHRKQIIKVQEFHAYLGGSTYKGVHVHNRRECYTVEFIRVLIRIFLVFIKYNKPWHFVLAVFERSPLPEKFE